MKSQESKMPPKHMVLSRVPAEKFENDECKSVQRIVGDISSLLEELPNWAEVEVYRNPHYKDN